VRDMRRSAPVVVALCLCVASVTACSAKIITSGAASSPRPSAASGTGSPGSGTDSAPPPTGPGVSVSNTRVTVNAPLGSFPIPPGSTVVENVTTGRTIDLVLGSVTPARVSSFYAAALPRGGFVISSNTLAAGAVVGASIKFTGHGYKGTIGAVSDVSITGITSVGNIVAITLTQQ
jgi:hypothetical protein